MSQDLRQALRGVLRMPGLSTVVVLSLAAGIGANTVVFSWIQARMLEPIPGALHSRDVRLVEPVSNGLYPGASWPEFVDLRERLQRFDGLFAARTGPVYLGDTGQVERVFGAYVSSNYFDALGVSPAIGRFFRDDEVRDAAGAPAAVISHRIWRSRFGGRMDALGTTVRLNGQDVPVIGVAPDRFQGTTMGLQFDVWLPATLRLRGSPLGLTDRRIRGYSIMGRLRPGVPPLEAQQELDAVMRELAAAYPASNTGVHAEMLPLHRSPRGPQRFFNTALAILQGVMLLVLAAICGNVANLLVARASMRHQEVGIRLSLGASRRRIVSVLMLECALLAGAGVALGAVFASWGTQALLVLPMTGLPIRFETEVDGTGLLFAAVLGGGCTLLSGAAPALYLARLEPGQALRASASTTIARSPLRNGLMAVQVGLALMVLVVAGMFLRALAETRTTDPGFRRDGIMLAAYDGAGRTTDAAYERSLASRILNRVAELPFAESAAIAASVPLDIHGLPIRAFTLEGRVRADGVSDESLFNVVTPGYFRVMDIPLLEGRDFSPLDREDSEREAVVNEAFVRRHIGDGAVLGRRIMARGDAYTIVGVVRTSVSNAFGEPPTPVIYFSYRDAPLPRGEIHVSLRGSTPDGTGAAIARVVRELDAELPVFNARTLAQHVDSNLFFRRLPAQLLGVLAPLVLALSIVGIYAVVAFGTSRRTREVGVRLALGATAGRVVRELIRESLSVAVMGAIVGWMIVVVVLRQVAPAEADPLVLIAAPVITIAAAALGCWIPARRAVRITPIEALRDG